jgi:hypothetical protein
MAPGEFKKFSSATQKQPDNVINYTLVFEP